MSLMFQCPGVGVGASDIDTWITVITVLCVVAIISYRLIVMERRNSQRRTGSSAPR